MSVPFLSPEYKTPVEGAKYLNKIQGEVTLRFLAPPAMGWVHREFTENAHGRKEMTTEDFWKFPNQLERPNPDAKFFWACKVWNFTENSLQYWELNKRGLIQALEKLSRAGHDLLALNVIVTRDGEGMNTSYSLRLDNSGQELTEDALEVIKTTPFFVENAFYGDDVFEETKGADRQQDVQNDKMEDEAQAKAQATTGLPEINVDDINVQMPF